MSINEIKNIVRLEYLLNIHGLTIVNNDQNNAIQFIIKCMEIFGDDKIRGVCDVFNNKI